MKTRNLLLKLAKRFPKSIAKKYHDYVGLMCGKLKENTRSILLCLDFDEEVFKTALKIQPDLIITHHPFIFGTKGRVLKYDLSRRKLYHEVEEAGLCIYSMHTNFDEGRGGMNDALAEALELENIVPLSQEPMGRIGQLKNPLKIEDFGQYVKERWNIEYGLLVPYGVKVIKSVAMIGGGGSRSFKAAKDDGADIFISGDAPHHVRRAVVAEHYNYLDVPHEVERIFMPTMKKILLEIDRDLDITIVDHEIVPEVI